MAGAWSYDCLFIRQFRPDTSYKPFAAKMEWPVYLTCGNVDSTIRSKASNLSNILVALLIVLPQSHFKGDGKTTDVKEQQIHGQEVSGRSSTLFFILTTCFSTLES